jgi:hypothetical protein
LGELVWRRANCLFASLVARLGLRPTTKKRKILSY